MNKKLIPWATVAALIILVILVFTMRQARESKFVGCGAIKVDVTIALDDGKIVLSPTDGDVRLSTNHKVRWTGPEGFEIDLALKEQKPGSKPGRLPVKDTKPQKDDLCYRVGKGPYTLKYTVTVPGAAEPLDPKIIVDP